MSARSTCGNHFRPLALATIMTVGAGVSACRNDASATLAFPCSDGPQAGGVPTAVEILNAQQVSAHLFGELKSTALLPESRVQASVLIRINGRGDPICYRIGHTTGSDRLDAVVAKAAMQAQFTLVPHRDSDADTWVMLPIVLKPRGT